MLERITTFRPAYDLRSPDPSRNYGIHNMVLQFAVKGPLGAVDATISTGWHLPQVAQWLHAMGHEPYAPNLPWFTNIGFHSKKPLYDYQVKQTPLHNCTLTGGDCWSDGSSLWGDEQWREGFLNEGSDWLFTRLEEYYRNIFEDGPMPNFEFTPVQPPERTIP